MLTGSYSNREPAGYVQKVFKKGWLRKTWKGEMAAVSMPGPATRTGGFAMTHRTSASAVMTACNPRVTRASEA